MILLGGILLVTGETLIRPFPTDKLIPMSGGPGVTSWLNVGAANILFILRNVGRFLLNKWTTRAALLWPTMVVLDVCMWVPVWDVGASNLVAVRSALVNPCCRLLGTEKNLSIMLRVRRLALRLWLGIMIGTLLLLVSIVGLVGSSGITIPLQWVPVLYLMLPLA